jgi:CDGSH-type Zn-finger protein
MASAKIVVGKNGPLRVVEGDFVIVDPEGNEYGLAGRTSISLCRCGHSENKPFCDGSHRRVEFLDDPHARELPPPVPKPS